MKNPASYIKQQLITLLNGTITYNAVAVPAFSGEGEVRDYQILIQSQNSTPRTNRDAFISGFEQVIEVVSEQATNTTSHVDAIGTEVMKKIQPSPKVIGVANNADFEIINTRLLSQTYLNEASGEGTQINRLILRYSFLITQI